MAYSDGGWTRTKPWACSSSPDRTGGCSAARPPAAAQSMRFCTSETGDEPCAVCAPETRRKSVLLATMSVCGGRACALGIRCDCVALQLAAAPSCWCQARRVQRAHRESNTGWAAGCNRIFNRGPPAGRRLQACRGRARLRCGRAIGRGPRVDSGRWGRDDGGELHTGTPNRALAAIGADKDAAASGRSCQNARTGDVSVARRAGRPSSGPFGLPSRRRWSPGRIHSCHYYYYVDYHH